MLESYATCKRQRRRTDEKNAEMEAEQNRGRAEGECRAGARDDAEQRRMQCRRRGKSLEKPAEFSARSERNKRVGTRWEGRSYNRSALARPATIALRTQREALDVLL